MAGWKHIVGALCAMMLGGAAMAQVAVKDLVQAEVLSGWMQPDGTRMSALRLVLAPGWKTYWRAPGDGGIPPRFDWEGSRNLGAVQVHWPRPIVETINGIRTIGYQNEVVLPLTLTARDTSEPITLRAQLDIGICEEICVPVQVDVALVLAGAGAADGRIQSALAARPVSGRKAGVSKVVCAVEPTDDGLRLSTRITLPRLGRAEVVLIEAGDPRIWVSEPVTERHGATLTAVADLVPPNAQPFALDRSAVRFTVLGGGSAVDIRGCTGD